MGEELKAFNALAWRNANRTAANNAAQLLLRDLLGHWSDTGERITTDHLLGFAQTFATPQPTDTGDEVARLRAALAVVRDYVANVFEAEGHEYNRRHLALIDAALSPQPHPSDVLSPSPVQEVLAAHFPKWCKVVRSQQYAGECSCGATFLGADYAAAKQAWAAHVALALPPADATCAAQDETIAYAATRSDVADDEQPGWPDDAQFRFGDIVTTPRKPVWQGPVCGWYRNSDGQLGFNVEATLIPGSIHNYPQRGLRAANAPREPVSSDAGEDAA